MPPDTKKTEVTQAATLEQESAGLLDQIIAKTKIGRDSEQKARSRQQLSTFVEEALNGSFQRSKDVETTISSRIAEIDGLLSQQLNEILHAPEFQKLEASWKGLHYLVSKSETSTTLKIRVLHCAKKELLRNFENASDFDQSVLFKKVYEEEFGTFGGDPISALIGDFEFTRTASDMALLTHMSRVAAAAHAPFLTAADPQLFNWDDFTELAGPRDLATVFDTPEYAKWKSFRNSDESRYVGLTLPHILMRLPYGPDTTPVETFIFKEDVDGKDHKKYLWGNAAYALGTRLTTAFAKYGWCAAIRGVENGGLVEGLPAHTFDTDQGDAELKCPTELAIPDRREKELADLGFIPLLHCKGTDYAAFFSAQSANKVKKYSNDAANANAELSAQLPYLMAVCRFAHYLKVMMRDKVGSFVSQPECERFLKNWITKYVTDDDNATTETKAKHPLRAAEIEVVEVPGKPGAFKAVAFLRPHFMMDELSVSLRLVAELPKPLKAK